MSTMFRDISSVDAMPSQIEPPSRIFGLSAGKSAFRPSLFSQDSSRLNMQQFGSSNNDYMSDQRHRTSVVQSTTLGGRSFGLQSRNLTARPSIIPEGSFRFTQEMPQRSGSTSVISKPFWPAIRNTTLTTGLQMQDSVRYNEDVIDNDGFRRPSALRIIRGRNPTYSSRLFHSQNTDRHYNDLSNINGFNVSHIPRREMDTLSESRLQLGMRSNCMGNQSLSGSVISTVSMKAQFMNLLENFYHSILSIDPHINAEAIRMEFDKTKQGLENISEMSFAPSIKPADTASVVSQSSKYRCPQINGESTVTNTLDGGSLRLKSGNDLLKTLVSSKNNYKRKFDLSSHVEETEEDAVITSSQTKESDDEEVSSLMVKKPRVTVSRRKAPRMKVKAPPAVKTSASKGAKAVINLKQWYPIAIGSDLAFCGIDEKGASVKTEAVKKRLSNRKVELINGTNCNLIGSPSTMVSVLPQIATRLKNGLTDRWRVLQRELLSCQTAEGEPKKRISKSPKVKSPRGKTPEKIARGRPRKGSAKKTKVISTPKKKTAGNLTRSGRAVKQPGMFWLANGSNEVSSTLELQSETTIQESAKRKPRKSIGRPPAKKLRKSTSASPVKKYKKAKSPPKSESPTRKTTSARKYTKAKGDSPKKKYQRAKKESPAKKQKRAGDESPSRKAKASGDASPGKHRTASEESPSKKVKKSNEETPTKKYKIVNEESPSRKTDTSEVVSPKKYNKSRRVSQSPSRKNKKGEESPSRKAKTSSGVDTPVKSKTVDSPKKSRRKLQVKSPKEKKRKGSNEEVKVHSSKEDTKRQNKGRSQQGKRKRESVAEADSVQAKKSKVEKKTEAEVESTVKSTESVTKGGKKTKGLTLSYLSPIPRGRKPSAARNKKETVKKKTVNTLSQSHNETTEFTEFEKNFDFKLDDIEIPEIANISGNPQLSRSQLRVVSMETPPLKYFNSNLKLLGSTTPMRSPDWCISQRTESEVKQFQKRREEAFKKRIKVNVQKTVVTEKNGQNKDVKRVMEWVSEKAVRSPQWTSKVLQYVIPSRKQMEEEQEEDEDVETEFY